MSAESLLLQVRRLPGSLRRRGFVSTLRTAGVILLDMSFDLKYGVDTMGLRSLRSLGIDHPAVEFGIDYEPTRQRELRKLLNRIVFPEGSVFVDFGSGKGRALMIASMFPFARVVGIELSSTLCDIARQNLVRFRDRVPNSCQVDVFQCNAAEYAIQPAENVFFLFNPFSGPVFSAVIRNIEASLLQTPRPIWILYRNPVHRELLDKSASFGLLSEHGYPGGEVLVYQSRRSLPKTSA